MTTRLPSEEQLEQEVRELTDLLRTDATFADLREALATKGLSASDTILAGLVEGEDESRYGVVLTADRQCVLFESDPDGSLIRWEIVEDPSTLTTDFQAVGVGIAMQKEGQIS
jgi:hypothetical protein